MGRGVESAPGALCKQYKPNLEGNYVGHSDSALTGAGSHFLKLVANELSATDNDLPCEFSVVGRPQH